MPLPSVLAFRKELDMIRLRLLVLYFIAAATVGMITSENPQPLSESQAILAARKAGAQTVCLVTISVQHRLRQIRIVRHRLHVFVIFQRVDQFQNLRRGFSIDRYSISRHVSDFARLSRNPGVLDRLFHL